MFGWICFGGKCFGGNSLAGNCLVGKTIVVNVWWEKPYREMFDDKCFGRNYFWQEIF
jgi:hypothetical protein